MIGLFLAPLAAPRADELVRSDEQRGPALREHRLMSPKPEFPLDAVEFYRA